LAIIIGSLVFDPLTLSNILVGQVIIVAAISYATGLVIDPIARLWYRLFRSTNFADVVLKDFTKTHEDLNVKFKSKDWPILLASIRQQSAEMADEIDRYNALHIMLRNISFNFFLLATIELTQFFRINFAIWHLVIFLILLMLSIVSGREAAKFNKWFYLRNYEATVAQSLVQSKSVKSK